MARSQGCWQRSELLLAQLPLRALRANQVIFNSAGRPRAGAFGRGSQPVAAVWPRIGRGGLWRTGGESAVGEGLAAPKGCGAPHAMRTKGLHMRWASSATWRCSAQRCARAIGRSGGWRPLSCWRRCRRWASRRDPVAYCSAVAASSGALRLQTEPLPRRCLAVAWRPQHAGQLPGALGSQRGAQCLRRPAI